jgi:hypothetical protein
MGAKSMRGIANAMREGTPQPRIQLRNVITAFRKLRADQARPK